MERIDQSEEFDLAYHRVQIILISIAKVIQYIMEHIQSYDMVKMSMIFLESKVCRGTIVT